MPLVSKEILKKWIDVQIKRGNWLQVDEKATQEGRQYTYLTFAGQFIIVQYDIKGDVKTVGQPILMPTPMPQHPLDFKPRYG